MPAAGFPPQLPERERLCVALLELLAERDYGSITLAQLLGRAGLPRTAFGRHFADLDDCFAALWDEVDAQLSAVITEAYRRGEEWQDRLRGAILAGLRYLAANPARARLYLSTQGVNDRVQRRQFESVRRLGQIIDRGREEGDASGEPIPEAIAEAIAGSIFFRVGELVRTGQSASLPEKLSELMYFAVLPYRGIEAAEAELRLA